MGYTIGLDIGGSTTKIVGVHGEEIISPIKVKAGDQITSAYGAFGKFLNKNHLNISDIDSIMITGVGSSFITGGLYGIPTKRMSEFEAIGYGGQYLSKCKRAIIVSMGTGTAFVRISDSIVTHLGGSGVGGGTLLGLADKMFNIRDFNHIVELAKDGNLSSVDLTVGDISRDILSNMPMETTASNFGRLNDIATNADIACGIVNLVFQTIGMLAIFASKADHISDIVLTGNLTQIPQAKRIFEILEQLHSVHFLIPENAEYATAIGAAISKSYIEH